MNCTKSDLDAITSGRDDVEILDYNSDLYYEKYYESVDGEEAELKNEILSF